MQKWEEGEKEMRIELVFRYLLFRFACMRVFPTIYIYEYAQQNSMQDIPLSFFHFLLSFAFKYNFHSLEIRVNYGACRSTIGTYT